MTVDELASHALQLTSRERARLAEVLIASLDGGDGNGHGDGDVLQAWIVEADRRYQNHVRGNAVAIPAAQVFAELSAELEDD